LSRLDAAKRVRNANELYLIMRRFFDDVPADLLREAFHHRIIRPTCDGELELRCEQAFLYLRSSFRLHQLIGVERLHDLLRDPNSADVLATLYGFTPASLADALTHLDVMNQLSATTSSVFVDTGNGFREDERIQVLADSAASEFCLRFDLPRVGAVRAVRWDPLEGFWCRVRLTNASYEASDGRSNAIDLSRLDSNGTTQGDGTIVFDTFDPICVLPITGDITALTIQGEWERSDAPQVIARLESRFNREREDLKASFTQTLQRERDDLESRFVQALQRQREELESGALRRLQREREALMNSSHQERERAACAHERALNEKQAELEAVLRSRSWSMTAPFRAARRRLARFSW
jgi:hypothetical protein